LGRHQHQGISDIVSELNRLYKGLEPLHGIDFEDSGFQWIDCHDASQSILSYIRRGQGGGFVIVVLNFTPVPREGYRLGVPEAGSYREVFNSDSEFYGGSNIGNSGLVATEPHAWMGFNNSISITVPPLGALILQP
jgi:1,4-alpha-glucan branching enzyme